MIIMLSPTVIVMNLLLFGKRFFELQVFLPATVVTFALLAASWQLHTLVAVTLRNRFPRTEQIYMRVVISILLFLLMTSLNITLIFFGYDYLGFLNYQLNETMYKWALVIGAAANVFVTFLQEGISSYEKWKITLKETEQLKTEYLQGQLIGLKSQVNPHFLFNSLNSLSSLISENRREAEVFLDEMSKVYRYLLRNNEEQLVDLQTELNFIKSYAHLLKSRYGEGIDIRIQVPEEKRSLQIPPLTLQMIFEQTLTSNKIGKDYPLIIELTVADGDWLEIRHNEQKKLRGDGEEDDVALTNISNKLTLLGREPLQIQQSGNYRLVRLPLLAQTESTVP